MLSLIFSIIGAMGALIFFIFQLISRRKQKFFWIKKDQMRGIWNAAPSFIAFICFLAISVSLFRSNYKSTPFLVDKSELARQVDSLSVLISSTNVQQESEKIDRMKREEELTKALKSKITSAYTVTTPVYRVDTVVVVIRDTANEKRIKEKLNRMQLKNFELTKTVDSLRVLNSARDREEK